MQLKFIIGVFAALFLVSLSGIVFLYFTVPGNYDDFAKCLTEKGFVMAGTDWCKFCKQQKSKFGLSFKFINYKNCDLEKAWCSENGVEGYPTWFSQDGHKYEGVQSLQQLSNLSGCELQ